MIATIPATTNNIKTTLTQLMMRSTRTTRTMPPSRANIPTRNTLP